MKDIRLKKRDLEILYHISTQSFATVSELYDLFWKSKKNSKSHYKRLYRLKEHRFIDTLKAPLNSESGYTITLKGQNLLRAYGYKVSPCVIKKDCYTGSYEHDLLLNSLKNILLKSPLVENFIPEYQIAYRILKDFNVKRKYQLKDKIPDGLFTLLVQKKPQKVALELELTLKSKRRYETIFSKHLLTKSWNIIFYIVKDGKMREKLLSYIKEFKRKNSLLRTARNLNSIYFSLLDEFLDKGLYANFTNERMEFSLKDLEKKTS